MNFSDLISQIRWRPQIGDPSVMGWLTVAAYAAAALLCFVAAHRCLVTADPEQDRRRRRMWVGVAVLMLLLCVNKQLDLQSLFTDVGRVLATRGGWYDGRRTVQLWFVIALAATGAMMFVIIAWKTRSILRERRLLLFGLSFLLTFIVIRAASFHHVGIILSSEIIGVRVNWILELGGISSVALSAVQSILRPRAGPLSDSK
jgi:hypothetical protein